MLKMLRWMLVVVGIIGLISVRASEDLLFYDPFLAFFKLEIQPETFPEFDWWPLAVSYLLRFLLNLFFSLVIIHFIFLRPLWTFQALVLMVVSQVLFTLIYFYLIREEFNAGYLFSFYVRRFVIQPLVLLVIIPLFYFRWKNP